MRNRITYGQSLVLCSQPPAYQTNVDNVSGLKRVQNTDVSFNFARQRFKQIGSEDFIGDRHLRKADIGLSIGYYYSNGCNEALMGLNVDGTNGCVLKDFKKENQDRNYYIVQGIEGQDEPFFETNFLNDYDVMGLGNVFLDGYSLSAAVRQPIAVSVELSAYNMQLDVYSDANGEYIPAIDAHAGTQPTQHRYKLLPANISDTTNLDSSIITALSPGDIELVLPNNIDVAGLELTGNNTVAHIQSMQLSFGIERFDSYGFGSLYPFHRKPKFPVEGSLAFEVIASEFTEGTLNQIVSGTEQAYDFTFNFLHCDGHTGLQITVQDAKVVSESFSENIGGNATMSMQFSFPLSSQTGLILNTPPLIIDQPYGSAGDMTTTATGKSPITYKWFEATTDTYMSSGPTYNPTVAGDYYCVAYNDLGSGISKTVSAT